MNLVSIKKIKNNSEYCEKCCRKFLEVIEIKTNKKDKLIYCIKCLIRHLSTTFTITINNRTCYFCSSKCDKAFISLNSFYSCKNCDIGVMENLVLELEKIL